MNWKYDVYFNLHKRVWSLRSCLDRKVNGRHEPFVVLMNVTFVVSEAGRQRVIRTCRKNVHAYARGMYFDNSVDEFKRVYRMLESGKAVRVTYNPYKYETFVTAKFHRPIYGARLVSMGVSYDTGAPMVIAIDPEYDQHDPI